MPVWPPRPPATPGMLHVPQPRSSSAQEPHGTGIPCPPQRLCLTQCFSLCCRSPPSLSTSLQPAQVPGRTHINAIRSRHSWGTGGPSRAGLSRRPSLRGRRDGTHVRKDQTDPRRCWGQREPGLSARWGPISGGLGWSEHPKASELCPGCLAVPPARERVENSRESASQRHKQFPVPSPVSIPSQLPPAPAVQGLDEVMAPLSPAFKPSTGISKITGRIWVPRYGTRISSPSVGSLLPARGWLAARSAAHKSTIQPAQPGPSPEVCTGLHRSGFAKESLLS